MAIGTIIGGALALGGSIIGAGSSRSAANKAADTSLQVARENNALAGQIYGQNQAALSPFMDRGNTAGNYLNAFLGLTPGSQTVGGAQLQNGNYVAGAPNTGAANGGVTQQQAQNAFGNYIANSDYGFQFGTGSNAVNSGYAGAGTLQSGAAMKALEQYRQNLQSGYRGEYLGQLANQQGVGLAGASALAGVGQNYVSNVSANNNNAGNAAANAALIRGQNNPFAAGLGALAGTIMG